ncbi:MAG TPA: DUF2784 family protein [Nitrospirota bacterium]|nr:DUF2784 family protein [Nitrospirota bacterium]
MKTADAPMKRAALLLLDDLFHALHLGIIIFFLFGWTIRETRPAHYALPLLILLSWYGLGAFRGFGYCIITDIQWSIKKRLGNKPSTEYYIKYLIDNITGLDTRANIVNGVTTYTYFIILILSTILLLVSNIHYE